MPFAWGITGQNKTRGTNGVAHVESVSTEAVGYPKENAIDGIIGSEWRASASPATIVIDTAVANPDINYICLRFRYGSRPADVDIETSDSPSSGFSSIANNYDGTIVTTVDGDLDGLSRTISVDDSSDIRVGNSVYIDDGSLTGYYLVVEKGTGYIVVDRYPEQFEDEADVTVLPDYITLAYVASGESKRYIKLTITATTPHVLEIQAFKVLYTFDGNGLPLNPFPVESTIEDADIMRSLSGHAIGKIATSKPIRKYSFMLQNAKSDTLHIIEYLRSITTFGFLMDNGEYIETMLANSLSVSRRPSRDENLLTYNVPLTVEEL